MRHSLRNLQRKLFSPAFLSSCGDVDIASQSRSEAPVQSRLERRQLALRLAAVAFTSPSHGSAKGT